MRNDSTALSSAPDHVEDSIPTPIPAHPPSSLSPARQHLSLHLEAVRLAALAADKAREPQRALDEIEAEVAEAEAALADARSVEASAMLHAARGGEVIDPHGMIVSRSAAELALREAQARAEAARAARREIEADVVSLIAAHAELARQTSSFVRAVVLDEAPAFAARYMASTTQAFIDEDAVLGICNVLHQLGAHVEAEAIIKRITPDPVAGDRLRKDSAARRDAWVRMADRLFDDPTAMLLNDVKSA